MQASPEAWSACVAGALDMNVYRAGLEAAGFVNVDVKPDQQFDAGLSGLPPHTPFSPRITAHRPPVNG